MNREERTEQKMQELFHSHAAGDEGSDGEFMQILQGYIFGDVCYTGSLDNRTRELVTVTVLTVLSALPQIKAHVGASPQCGLHAGGDTGGCLSVRALHWFPQDSQCHCCYE